VNAFFETPQSLLVRRRLFQIHLWTGIATRLYILVACTTDAALVFRIDLPRAQHLDLFTPSGAGPAIDAATLMERVRDAYPTRSAVGHRCPEDDAADLPGVCRSRPGD